MEIHQTKKSRDELPAWGKTLSGDVVPRYIGIMETDHGGTESAETQLAQLMSTHSVPEEVARKLAAELPRITGEKKRTEYNIVMVIENKKDGAAEVIVGIAGRIGAGAVFVRDKGGLLMDTEPLIGEHLEQAIMSARTTFVVMQYRKDWNGERKLPAFDVEGKNLDTALKALEKAGYSDVFRAVFTVAEKEKTPAAIPARVSKAQRAALVKRFGAAAIKTLEARMKERQKS